MQQIVKLTEKHIAVVVPEEYKNFVIKNYGFAGYWLMETDSKELNHWKVFLSKGNGSYSFLFISSQATEEDAKKVVEWTSIQEMDLDGNLIGEKEYDYWVDKVAHKTALSALSTLLRSKGITTPVAILEINK